MKKICYVIPYFGKLPKGFEMWLLSCGANETIDWILYTDDRTVYDFPVNVKVKYCSYDEIKEKIQSLYNFKISISKPWKLCEFKPAYGEIFSEDIQGYDFWGHCDMDLIWGDIRKFITDEILDKYEKIGFQGHSTLYKNTPEVNARYRICIDGIMNYQEAFTNEEGCFFDEVGMCNLYDALDIPFYKETNFAHLDRFTNSFFLLYLPEDENYKNNRQIFTWEKGVIKRHFVEEEKVRQEEYMYLHLFSRPISFKTHIYCEEELYVIYPDIVRNINKNVLDLNFVKRHGRCSVLRFYVKVAYFNRKKITLKKIIFNLKKKRSLSKQRGYK